MTRLSTALPLFAALLAPLPALSADPDPSDWDAVLEQAQGQTVYWHAWGGSTATNDFIAWIGEQVAQTRRDARAREAGRHRRCRHPRAEREAGRSG